jgi:hypothetical protein
MNDIERLQRQLYALTEIAKTLTLPLELPELLNAVIQKIVGVIEPAEVGAVMVWINQLTFPLSSGIWIRCASS